MHSSLLNSIVGGDSQVPACITADQLRLYSEHKLSGKGLRAVELHLADCELCSAAADGFLMTAVSAAELSQINSRIDSLSGASWFGTLGSKIILAFSVLALTGAGLWMFAGKTKDAHIPDVAGRDAQVPTLFIALLNAATPRLPANATLAETRDTSYQAVAENFIQAPTVRRNPTKQNSSIQAFNADNYANSNSIVKPGNLTSNTASNTANDNNSALAANLANDNANNDVLVLPEYNRPIQYIHSLKVSEYNELYFSTKAPAANHGTPSPLESKQTGMSNEIPAETVRMQRADLVLNDALLHFKSADYGGALTKFRLLLDLNGRDINSLFYSGLCYYNLNKPDKAIACFENTLALKNNAFHEEALWYKALAFLMKSDKAAAKEILLVIVRERGFYAKQAKEKLKEFR